MQRTADQLEKDFSSAGVALSLGREGDWSFDKLHEQLLPEITQLVNTSFEQLLSLLYRIDVPEKRIAEASQSGGPLASAITTLVIQRELMKVLLREWMKQQE